MLRISDTTRANLQAGQVVTATVWPAGEEDVAPATLEWSFESGATVRLVEPTDRWQLPFNSGHHVADLAVNGGEEYSMLDARVNGSSADGRIARLGAYTLALGAHTDNAECWPAAEYSTANLTEWFGDSGIDVTYPDTDDVFIRLHYQAPARREVTVDAGKLVFGSTMETPGRTYAADWSISTRQTMWAVPNDPSRIEELSRRFAHPLRALISFVSDRPDSVIIERLVNAEARREALIWRVAARTEVRPWRAISDYLFRVPDVEDFTSLVQIWFALYDKVDPALGYFAHHVNDGSTYSPERLVLLFAALEAYGDIHRQTTDLKALRNQTGVAASVTGGTNSALALLGSSRGYFAHPSKHRHRRESSDAKDSDGIFPSIRRASALMQSCLLRDLGFDVQSTTEILQEHYRSWPLP
jgi:hypothetical protein